MTKSASGRSRKTCEGCVDLPVGAGIENSDLQSHAARCRFQISQGGSRTCGIGWIEEHGQANGFGHQFAQELKPLCRQLSNEDIDACQVAAWPGETRDKSMPDRVLGGD